MKEITERAWEMFRSRFKDGQEVIVENQYGNFYYGKLKCHNDYITITSPGGISKDIHWDNIEFICHEGFPAKRILGMTVEEANKRADETDKEIIRAAFIRGELSQSDDGVYYGGGCPFIAGPMFPNRIFNKGSKSVYEDDCEVMEFVSFDGAFMHSYDTNHLFILP